MNKFIFILSMILAVSSEAYAKGNPNSSFTKAKKLLKEEVYYDHRETFYCKASFDEKGHITLPEGVVISKFEKRAHRLEWEHVVPAENFGRIFEEWRNGHEDCVTVHGEKFVGRKCAEKVNPYFAKMQADMYNLYPAIGSVNALRSNYNYAELGSEGKVQFGSCEFKKGDRKVEPPSYTKGAIARTYLYFEDEYSLYHMSPSQKKLMKAWDKMYPVEVWECERNRRIEKIQGNKNWVVKKACEEAGFNG